MCSRYINLGKISYVFPKSFPKFVNANLGIMVELEE